MILVTGSTGHVGSAILDQLSVAGTKARALVRDPARASNSATTDVVVGDFDRPETLASALDGVRAMFLMVNNHYDEVIELARQAGVEHIVLLSSGTIDWLPDNPIARQHSVVEDAVRASGLAWTFVRPGNFMSNAMQWAQGVQAEGVVRAPFGGQLTTPVDPRDIAAVVTSALLSSGHAGQIYRLTGPEALTPAEQTVVLARVLANELRFEELSVAQAREFLVQAMPEAFADAYLDVMTRAKADMAVVRSTVQDVTGHAPRTFEQWATDNAEAFR